jgi:hypothetical protein
LDINTAIIIPWDAFVRHANRRYRASFLAMFETEVGFLSCEGPLDGNAGCPRGSMVDVEDRKNWPMLDQLHLDHRYDLKVICDAWKGALPPVPTAWDQGIDGELLCHLLFGTRDHPRRFVETRCEISDMWSRNLAFRCAPARHRSQLGEGEGDGGQRQRGRDYCHETGGAHYAHVVTARDLQRV